MEDNLGYEDHPAIVGSETTDLQGGTWDRISAAITRGAPAAAISGALGIYNTALDYTGKDKVDIEEAIRKYDDATGDYYADHKQSIDVVGFVGASLVPGTLGVKALQLARGGQALGSVGRALNLTASRRDYYMAKALEETAQSGGVIKSILSTNRVRQAGWEVADQALLGAAFELGVLATMNDAPVFDGDTAKDFAFNFTLGVVGSGVIGGAFASLGAKGILKSAQTEIQGAMRQADTVFNPAGMGLNKGTEALLFAESIAKLPDTFGDIAFKYTLDGRKMETMLPVSAALKSAKDRAEKLAYDQLALKFNELAEGNPNIGQAFFAYIREGMSATRAIGRTESDMIDTIAGQLNNLARVSHVDLDAAAMDARKFYVNLSAPATEDATEFVKGLITPKRTLTSTKQPYRLADGVKDTDIVMANLDELGEQTLKATFRANPEVDVVRLADGTLRVNPKSQRIIKMAENPNKVKMFIDLETGTHTPETVALFGDILGKAAAKSGDDFIAVGRRTFLQAGSKAFDLATSPLEATARWAWVADKEISEIVRITGNRVDLNDLPVLQRLVELEPKVSADTLRKMKFIDNGTEVHYDELVNLARVAEARRYELLEKALNDWTPAKGSVPDVRAMAAHLNVSRDWVEEAIDRGFRPPVHTSEAKGKVFETADALRPKTVQAEWEFPPIKNMLPEEAYNMNMGPNHLITKELTREYQLRTREQIGQNVAAAVLGDDFKYLQDLNRLSRDTSIEGAGAQVLGASNANYGARAQLAVQDTGKQVALITQRRRDEVVGALAPHINALRESQAASAELGILTTALRKNPSRFVFDPDNTSRIVSQEAVSFAKREKISLAEALDAMPKGQHPHYFDIANDQVVDFLRASTKINAPRVDKFTSLYNAAGLTRSLINPEAIYIPPINTAKYPYHALVRTKEKVGLTSDVSMITAKSEEQLRELAAKVDTDKFDVLFKKDTDNYFKAKGEYDYSMGINEATVNSELARSGALADHFPETRLENVMTDWLEWHAKQEEKLVRTAVEVKNRQFFSEVRALSENFRAIPESQAQGLGSKAKNRIADPFGDYIKTALNISKQQEVPLLDALNDFVDKVGVKAGDAMEKAFREAKGGILDWSEANKVADRYGLGMPYKDIDTYFAANERLPRNLIKESFQKANMWLATATLRLDFANSLLNIISTPIMLGTEMSSIKNLIKNDNVAAGALRDLMSIKVPGKDFSAPSTVKLTANAISNFFGKDKAALMARYRDIGSIKEVSQLYHEVLDDLSFRADITPKAWVDKVNAAIEKGAAITGNTFAEDFTRFVSADVMRQLSDPVVAAGKLTVKEQNAYISSFVNRVQGNYVTSQRPLVFQGTTGAAISLFQTYAFNVLQQLHRHMQAGDKKTLAVFAGLQSSVFGFNGLPFFDAVNTHLIGSMVANNPQHNDAYNILPGFNKELGDWMLYGTASAFPLFSGNSPALYSRGDINPRHVTILPVSPADVPAVQASMKLIDTVTNFAKSISNGADMSSALLQGLEHQGLNRPLAGFAQLLAGQSTTSKGTLISSAAELQSTTWLGGLKERLIDQGGVSRLMGARPMDEAVALNQMYRNKTYEALDRSRLERLGSAVKTKLYDGQAPTDEEIEDFMTRYARSGGRIENFSQFIQRASRDANVSVVNQTMAKVGQHKRLMEIMGGEELPDYRNQNVPEDGEQ